MRWWKEKLDRWAIRTAANSLPRVRPDPAQCEEVLRTLALADLFVPPERVPNVIIANDRTFSFRSTIQTPYTDNNEVHGRIIAASGPWRTRPSVVLMHGWNAEGHYVAILPKLARALNRRGMNGVLMELPYHLQRRPPRGEAVTNFISENIPRMLEATAQAVADLNALVHWLKKEGSPAVAIWGFSLGGWLAGLHVTVSAAQDAAVLETPVSNLAEVVGELEFCHPIRSALEVVPADLRPLNLSLRQPKIAPERILLVEAEYDQFIRGTSYQELAAAWGIQTWMKVPQSHISILVSRAATRGCIEWLEKALAARR